MTTRPSKVHKICEIQSQIFVNHLYDHKSPYDPKTMITYQSTRKGNGIYTFSDSSICLVLDNVPRKDGCLETSYTAIG